MKKFVYLLISLFVFLFPLSQAEAVHVNGYYRSNGTYVNSYERTSPDSSPYNNYGYPGNYNPNTGSITGGSQTTYLNNYYKSSSYSSYTPQLNCPINSYYDGVSSCKCNYGYSVSGGSCVSMDSLCNQQLGYSSSYNSLNNTCQCSYGYVIGTTGKCTSATLYCSSQLGLMSQYNSLTNKCECMSGYEFNGFSCTYKTTTYSFYSNPPASTYSCPSNSHISTTDSTKCQCDLGYQPNSAKNSCVALVTTTPQINNSTIGTNYYINNHTCAGLTGDQYSTCVTYAYNH